MLVDIDYIRTSKLRLAEINLVRYQRIVWCMNGKTVSLTADSIELLSVIFKTAPDVKITDLVDILKFE